MSKIVSRGMGFITRSLMMLDSAGFSLGKVARLRQMKKNGIYPSRFLLYDKKWIRDAHIRTVLDIGANVGEFTAIFAELFPEATIYAFEPLPDCYAALEKVASRYNKVRPLNVAVGAEESVCTMYKSSWAPASSIRKMDDLHKENYPHSAKSEPIEVSVRSLDRIFDHTRLEEGILVKIDVQGFEDEVIRGGLNVLKKASIIVIESSFKRLYHEEPMFNGIYSLLYPLGFEYKGSLKQSICKDDESFLQADCIFMKRN